MNEVIPNPAAAEYGPRWKRLGWLCVGWFPVVFGAVAFVVFCFFSHIESAMVLAFPTTFFAAYGFGVILHELAHFFVARFAGLHPYRVVVGLGPVVWQRSFSGAHWVLKALPACGFVYTLPLPGPNVRWRTFLMTASGPAANGVLVIVSSWMIWLTFQDRFPAETLAIFLTLMLANGWLLLGSLLPSEVKIDGRLAPSDGVQLFQLLKGSHPAAVPHGNFQTMSSDPSAQTLQMSTNWESIVKFDRASDLLQYHLDVLQRSDLPPAQRYFLLDSFATAVLMAGAVEYLTDADRFSHELLAAKPDELTVKGTRGSVLIEIGKLDEGAKLLREVFENDPLPFDRALAAAYLGLAALKREDALGASEWFSAARELDPNCVPLKRLQPAAT